MSQTAGDLYKQGVRAYNNKDFKSAKAYWEQALMLDPDNEAAQTGMDRLRAMAAKGKKRSSKEVFQEIKQLYAAKKFPEALKLTNLLLKKHPDNKDLQGLKVKLEKRVQGSAASTVAASPESGNDGDKRSTMFMAAAAEASVGEATDDGSDDHAAMVEKYIQDGVSLYEIQSFEQAIEAWKKALALDPNNSIAKDYITNVSALIEDQDEDEPEPVSAAPQAEPEPVDSGRPSKEEMLTIYNEGMELYKARDYHAALDKWNYILEFYPNHTETLQCIEKTEAALAKENSASGRLDDIRAQIQAGQLSEAESALMRLSIESPNLEGLDAVRDELDATRRASKPNLAAMESLGLDNDDEEDLLGPTPTSAPSSAAQAAPPAAKTTPDDINSFFSEKKDEGPRKVATVKPVKKKNKAPVNVFKVFGFVALLAVLGAGGYYGYDMYSKRLRTDGPAELVVQPIAPNWNSKQQVIEDFYNFGSDFEDEGSFLFAFYAYSRVDEIGSERLEELKKGNAEGASELEISTETNRVSATLTKARSRHRAMLARVKGKPTSDREIELALTNMRREEYQDAADRLKAILQADPRVERARELLGKTEERLAFAKLNDGDLSSASIHFKRAAVLNLDYELPRRHLEVIQRYFNGKIEEEQKNQWFYFFK